MSKGPNFNGNSEGNVGSKEWIAKDSFSAGLTGAIRQVAALRLQQAHAITSPQRMEEALRSLQNQLEELQLTEEKPVPKELVTFSLMAKTWAETRRNQRLFESLPILYISTDLHGEISKSSQLACEAFNIPMADLKSKPLAACVARSDRQIFRKAVTQLRDKRALFVPSLFFQHRKHKEPVEYSVHAIPVIGAEDPVEIDWILTPVLAPVTIWSDPPTRSILPTNPLSSKLPETGQEINSQELQALRDYATSHANLSTAPDVEGLLDSLVSEIAYLIGDHCFLSVLSPERTHLLPTAAASNSQSLENVIRQFLQANPEPLSDKAAHKVVSTQQPAVIANSTAHEQSLDQITHAGPVNILMVPLRAGKTTIGLLTLLRDKTENPYQNYEVIIMQNLADHVGVILRYLEAATTSLQVPDVEPLHAAFLGEVCTELQASLHAMYGYVDMLKEQVQELKLADLENDMALVVETADQSNRILKDTFEIAQIDIGVRKPSVEPHPLKYFMGELIGIVRHFPTIKELSFDDTNFAEDAVIRSDIKWAAEIVQKVLGRLSCESSKVRVTGQQTETHVSLDVQCEGGQFTHRFAGASCTVGRKETAEQPIYKRGVELNLAHRLCDKLGARIDYSSNDISFESVVFTFPLEVS